MTQRPQITQHQTQIPAHAYRDDVIDLCRWCDVLVLQAILAQAVISYQCLLPHSQPLDRLVKHCCLLVSLMPIVVPVSFLALLLYQVSMISAISFCRQVPATNLPAWAPRFACHP
jgi:hypothetical protein